jgi:Cysteine rich repeat
MKITLHSMVRLALLPLLAVLSVGSASAQTNIADAIVDKLTAQILKVEKACASDIRKYCRNVTPGEGRIVHCMQAYEDKISDKCAYELGETKASVEASANVLKDALNACKPEINGVCGKTPPGKGRVAACLIANKATASKDCADYIQKVEALAAK